MPRPPNTVRASWDITVSSSEGIAPIKPSKNVMPKNKTPRIDAIQIKVIAALSVRGSLNAVTPLETASMPVSAVVPLANARKIKNNVIG
jgi:transposase